MNEDSILLFGFGTLGLVAVVAGIIWGVLYAEKAKRRRRRRRDRHRRDKK